MLRPTVSLPVCLGIHLGPKTRFLLLSHICGFLDLGHPLWRENAFVIYSSCWSSPEQSFSGPSPVGLMIIFYCLRFETPPTWRGGGAGPHIYVLQETEWPSYTPGTGFPFRRLLRLAGIRWRYSTPPPRSALSQLQSQSQNQSQSQSHFTTGGLLPIISSWRQPLETHDQRFFFRINPCGHTPYVTSPLTRRWVCLLWIRLAFGQVYVSNIQHVIGLVWLDSV
jgi:hypothetical protein